MDELLKLRNDIDEVDDQLLSLYKSRMELAKNVGKYKKRNGLPIYNAEREAEIISRRCGAIDENAVKSGARELFTVLMTHSRRLQREIVGSSDGGYSQYKKELEKARRIERPRVVYQGETGAFGEAAARRHFGQTAEYSQAATFEDVFKSVTENTADYGVLPVENSLTGAISIVYDLLGRYGCRIAGEEICEIDQNLLALPGAGLDDIREIYSHEQGFLQSDAFLSKYPGWKRNIVGNTATAARMVAQGADPSKAAIAGKSACEVYGLNVLESEINDRADNSTRFFVISKDYQADDTADKVSVIFSTPHEHGSLSKILSIFASAGLNLLKLESRPKRGENWNYSFFADFSGSLLDPGVDEAVKLLFAECVEFRVLGAYKAGAR